MVLHSIKLHLLLLAIASSSGYVLFYLASNAEGTTFRQNLAHWTHFAIETPVIEYRKTAATTALPPVSPQISKNEQPIATEILLSGRTNSAPLSTDFRTLVTDRRRPQQAVSVPTDEEVLQDTRALRPISEPKPQPAADFAGTDIDAVTPAEAQEDQSPMLVFGKSHYGNDNAAFMDTSLLVAKGGDIASVTRDLSPLDSSLQRSSEEDAVQTALRSETTAGLISPGESFVGEINLAARAYISNTSEFKYQMNVGFVVESPNTELIIYALSSSLDGYGVTAPGLPPAFRVYDAAGQLILSSTSDLPSQSGDPAIVHVFEPGAYQVVVSAASGSAGEVVVGVKDYYSVQVE